MMMPRRRSTYRIRLTLISLALLAGIAHAAAQSFPSKPIRIVVHTTGGSPPDIISRVIAAQVSETEGWQVVVENRPGGSQTLAVADVLKQNPDGYSIAVLGIPVVAGPAVLPNVSFRPDTDLAPVIKVEVDYNVLVVTPSVPATSVAELIALLRQQPGKFTFSSGGFGTPAHLIGELFKLQTGVSATHVPYQQFTQAIADLLNGTNQYMFITTLPVVDLINSGRLRALAVTGPKRLAALKDVPTIAEEGLSGLAVEGWQGFSVKSGTPSNVIARLNQAVNRALTAPKVRETFASLGAEPAGGSPADYGNFVTAQVAYWAKVVKNSGIKMHQ